MEIMEVLTLVESTAGEAFELILPDILDSRAFDINGMPPSIREISGFK